MTKNIFGRGMFLLLVAVLALAPTGNYAAELRTGDQSGTSSTERIADDLYITGGNVVSAGTIIGDLVVAGGNITVSGTVSTDVLVAGGTVTILGNVQDDLRAAGGNITINGTVDGDAIVAGGNVQLTGKRIGGDVVAGGGSIRIDTPVAKDVRIVGGQVTLNAPITGNVEVDAETLTLGSGAVITGNLTYRSPKEAVLQPGALVKGKTSYTPVLTTVDREKATATAASVISALAFMSFLTLLCCSLLFGLGVRRYATMLANTIYHHPWSEMGRGLLALISWPIIAILLMATVIGIPLGGMALLGYVIFLIFAYIAAPVMLGSILYHWMFQGEIQVTWKTVLLGVLAYSILAWIPIVGWILRFTLFLATIGTGLKAKWDIAKNWR